MNAAGAQASPLRENSSIANERPRSLQRPRLPGLLPDIGATRPIQITDSRLPVLDLRHRSRSRRRSFGSSVRSSMYVSEHPAHLISDVGPPGRLSRSSVVLRWVHPVCLVRRSPRAHVSNSVDGVRCSRDELIPARHGFNNAMQRRPGTAVGRKVSSPPQCMTRSSALPLSSY